jgi:myo-inositol-hexaphosphate 3-phosphohydrolase
MRTLKIYFLALLIAPTLCLAQVSTVSPSGQTAPVPSSNGARDLAVWIHPTDTSQSLIVATDQITGVVLFQLDGGFVAQNSASQPIAVDLRYNFPLAGQRIALIAVSQRVTNGRIGTFTIISTDGGVQIQDVSVLSNITNVTPSRNIAGLAMYRSPISGNYYAFITDTDGGLQEWQLFDDGTGRVNGSRVRTLSLSSAAEGCVADDLNSQLYVAEEAVGIWKIGAEPDAGTTRVLIDSTDGGHLAAPVKGLALYRTRTGSGYLVASSQGDLTYAVYRREPGNAYLGSFQVDAGTGVPLLKTNGLDVSNFGLGASFPEGVFIAQNATSADSNTGPNFKLVPWGVIAQAFYPNLAIDPTFDPRLDGTDGGTPDGGTDGGSGGSGPCPTPPCGPAGGGALSSSGCGCTSTAAAAWLPLAVVGTAAWARFRKRRDPK